MTHMKRYSVPRFWKMPKKKPVYVIATAPGPHAKMKSMPAQVLLRDVLGLAKTAHEVKSILRSGSFMVDKRVRKDPKFPVGMMDVFEIPDAGVHFRMGIDNHGLAVQKISQDESHVKLCMITGKRTIKGGTFQLSLHDGRNMLLKKNEYSVGDSLLISLPSQSVLKHYKFEKGAKATIISGKNIGATGKVKDFTPRKEMLGRFTVTIETPKKEITTLRDCILIGDIEKHPKEEKEDRIHKKAKKKETVKKKNSDRKAKYKAKKGRKKAAKVAKSKKEKAE